MLTIAREIKLPTHIATSTTLIVGKRGSGKSNTAVRLAEQLYRAKIPFAALDPVDVWWGLKCGADGQQAGGLNVYVFGGQHADLPLEATAGKLMADVLVDHRISAVFVLREFSNREKAQFVADFADQLYRRNRDVLHLFCEEAHEVMPQQPFRGEEEMLGRMLRLQKQGRTSGIGLTSITQRPASLNKNATTQAEILLAHRLLGPQDRDAIEAWIKYHHVEDQKQAVLSTLPTLKTGEAWLWAPDFPEDKPFGLERIKILKATTYDSRRTPKPGEKRLEPTALAPVDLEKIRVKMAKTIEKARAEDPKELRRQVAELQRRLNLAERVKEPKSVPAKMVMVEVPMIGKRELKKLESMIVDLRAASQVYDAHQQNVKAIATELNKASAAIILLTQKSAERELRKRHTIIEEKGRAPTRPHMPPPVHTDRDETMGRAERMILTAAVQMYPQSASRIQLSILSGYSITSSGFANAIGKLRSLGYLDGRGNDNRATDAGIQVAGEVPAKPTGADLVKWWMDKLGKAERHMLAVLVEAAPMSLTRAELSERSGYSLTSSGFANALGKLRSLGLIVGRGDDNRASDELAS
jgi:hypothetical protein